MAASAASSVLHRANDREATLGYPSKLKRGGVSARRGIQEERRDSTHEEHSVPQGYSAREVRAA